MERAERAERAREGRMRDACEGHRGGEDCGRCAALVVGRPEVTVQMPYFSNLLSACADHQPCAAMCTDVGWCQTSKYRNRLFLDYFRNAEISPK